MADFGLARYVIDDQYTSNGGAKFPIKWSPPEVKHNSIFHTKFSTSLYSTWIFWDDGFTTRKNIEVKNCTSWSNDSYFRLAQVLNFTRFSSKSDVWAYGVLCWEVFTCGEMPYGRAKNPEVVERVQRGQILSQPTVCPNQVYEVGVQCTLECTEFDHFP